MNEKSLNLRIDTDIDAEKARVSFESAEGELFKWKVVDDAGFSASGEAATSPNGVCEFSVKIPDPLLWNIETPHLYKLKVTHSDAGDDSILISMKFGMRKIHVEGNDILVNDVPFIVRGYIRGREAHDHPNLKGIPLYDYYADNIKMAKKYGFNFIRFHSKIPSEECFAAADDLGIFIHVEIRKYFGKYQKEREFMKDDGEIINEEQWREAIAELRNHPSLMVYCMGNEIRHPGTNPFVEHIADVTHELDPSRLFIDTCAHGEFDREYVDIDVQHMSYFYPFGKDYDMMNNTQNWLIFGSSKGVDMTVTDKEEDYAFKIRRVLPVSIPVLAHEICHYAALRDLDVLDEKFEKYGAEKPWWINEVRKLVESKGLKEDYPEMLAASRHFQQVGWKLGIEGVRRSPLLSGYHFLQLSDTERYENCNGLIDCFDDATGVDERTFKSFNGDIVLLADLPKRTYFCGASLTVPVILSHFSPAYAGNATFKFELKSDSSSLKGEIGDINLDERGRREIVLLKLNLPKLDNAEMTVLTLSLATPDGETITENFWKLWIYPDKPGKLPAVPVKIELSEVNPVIRYPQLELMATSEEKSEKLVIAKRFTDELFDHFEAGGDVFLMYRVPETRHRKNWNAKPEKYYLPATWDRLKGVIWDRGHNLGAFIRENSALDGFPNEKYLDLQFHALVDDCDKICLDDFPVEVKPIIQGVDKASRDRFDVYNFKYSELMPEWTMRKFAYLFELRVGNGRLLVSGFNFTHLDEEHPETCAMFETLLNYVTGENFAPKTEIGVSELRDYLLQKAAAPRIRERQMTQYWQLDEEPLESAKYWEESQEYIQKGIDKGGK